VFEREIEQDDQNERLDSGFKVISGENDNIPLISYPNLLQQFQQITSVKNFLPLLFTETSQ
jgi:hypothetical protein